jgi:hypothetical protein
MKKPIIGFIIVVFSIFMASTAFAGTWRQDSKGWRYQNDDGSWHECGWFKDKDGNWYYFNQAGYMLTNATTPDGYQVAANGTWIQTNSSNELSGYQKDIIIKSIIYDGKETHYTADLSEKQAVYYMSSLITHDTNDRNYNQTTKGHYFFDSPQLRDNENLSYYYNEDEVIKKTQDLLGVSISKETFAEAYLNEKDGYILSSGTSSEEGSEITNYRIEDYGNTIQVYCTWKCWNNIEDWVSSSVATFKKNPESFFGYTLVSY